MQLSLAVVIWNQPAEDAYPISAFTYILVYKDLSYLGNKAKAQEHLAALERICARQCDEYRDLARAVAQAK